MNSIERFSVALTAVLLVGVFACAGAQPGASVSAARPVQPGSGETIALDRLVLIADSSASVTKNEMFVVEKDLIESYVASVPDGDYEVGSVGFGGFRRQHEPLASFDRDRVAAAVSELRQLDEGTPLYKVFDELQSPLADLSGKTAIVLFSDGLPTDEFGRDVGRERTLTAAAELAKASEASGGTICIHSVGLGDSERGSRFLQELSAVTKCGSYRPAASATGEPSLHAFHRQVFFGSLPAVAAAPPSIEASALQRGLCGDLRGDPSVDDRGCWEASVGFAFDSAELGATQAASITQVAETLRRNPDLRLRIEGYTDSSGDPAYNVDLSRRRAEAAKAALVSAGVESERVDVTGRGAENPIAPNDTPANRRQNRRALLELVR